MSEENTVTINDEEHNLSELDVSTQANIARVNEIRLEIMVAKDDWGSESMTATNAAIKAGNGYTAS